MVDHSKMRTSIATSRAAIAGLCRHSSVVVHASHSRELPEWFVTQREDILNNLTANRNDKSLAGRVDPLIVPLVSCINGDPRYVTLSSCSGRFSLFHRINAAAASSVDSPESTVAPAMKRGSGQGTLFQTHEPFDAESGSAMVAGSICDALQNFVVSAAAPPRHVGDVAQPPIEMIQLKFEPMILHVMCSGLDDAIRLLNAANDAGLRRSGVLAVSRRSAATLDPARANGDHSRSREGEGKYTVNVTSALHFDVPLMADGRWCVPMTTAPHELSQNMALRHCVHHWTVAASGLFVENTTRMHRLETALRQRRSIS